MAAQSNITFATMLILACTIGLEWVWASTALFPYSSTQSSQSSSLPKQSRTRDRQWNAYKDFLEAEKRAEAHLFAAMPGRSRSWRLQSERILRSLEAFGQDIAVLATRQSAFEATLTVEEQARFDADLRRIHGLSHDIARDTKSLQDELLRGYASHWHVDADTSHMYKELDQWKKLDRLIAESLGLGPAKSRVPQR
jgi:hypothetical protein